MLGSEGGRCLTWTVAGLPEATVRAAGASSPGERAPDCVEEENHQHTPRAGEPGLWYHGGGLYGHDVWGQIRKVQIRVDSGPGRERKPGVSWLLQNSSNPREDIRVKACRKCVREAAVPGTGSRRRAAGTRDNKEKQAGATPTPQSAEQASIPVWARAPFNVLRAGKRSSRISGLSVGTQDPGTLGQVR